jgi:endonuclease/exonuclease/phosphatase family metal-dependent hydrolase
MAGLTTNALASPNSYGGTATPTPHAGSLAAVDDPPITAMTYNVRNPTGNPDDWNWPIRFPKIISVIKAGDPGILGIDEARETSGFDAPGDLIDSLTTKSGQEQDSDVYGVAIPANYVDSNGNYVPRNGWAPKLIFYRTTRFSVVGGPNDSVPLPNPYSSTDACFSQADQREIGWTILNDDRTNQKYFVVNTHPTPGGACWKARNQAAAKLHTTIKANNPNNYPVIVTCDCNFDDMNIMATRYPDDNSIATIETEQPIGSSSYQLLRTLSYSNFPTNDNQKSFLNDDWPTQITPTARLDYIFLSKRLAVDSTQYLRNQWPYRGGSATPSDHYGFVSVFHFPRG